VSGAEAKGARAAERAYGTLRAAIVGGRLAPGTRLRESDLADWLGVSRTPVREALRRLAEGGLVDTLPNRGAVVAQWSNEDMREIFGITGLLQAYGARLAADRIPDDELAELTRIVDEAERVARTGDAETIWSLDRAFHDAILAASGNRTLAALVAGVLEVPQTPPGQRRDSPERIASSLRYHREIVEALTHRNADWAEALTRAHFHAALATLGTSASGDGAGSP
jgi:DNA-binding GntR family transcriptional regulator